MIVKPNICRFASKNIAYKTAICRQCEREQYIVRVRTFDFLALFRLPIVPLFYHRRWVCCACDQDPYLRHNASMAVIGIIYMIDLLLLGLCLLPEKTSRLSWEAAFPMLVVFGTIAIVFTAYIAYRFATNRRLEILGISGYEDNNCILCDHELKQGKCPSCGVVRLEIARKNKLNHL